MAKKIERFEDLIAWQKAMDLAERAYGIADRQSLRRDISLRDQMHRAAISVPSNIAEGFERGTRREFHRFLSIAKGSCAELRTQISLAARIGYIDLRTASTALAEAEQVARIIGKLRVTLTKPRTAERTHHSSPITHN